MPTKGARMDPMGNTAHSITAYSISGTRGLFSPVYSKAS